MVVGYNQICRYLCPTSIMNSKLSRVIVLLSSFGSSLFPNFIIIAFFFIMRFCLGVGPCGSFSSRSNMFLD